MLHCNGEAADTAALLRDCPPLSEPAERRLALAQARMQRHRRPLDAVALAADRDAWLSAAA
ncbi:hypothetical protein ACFQU2_07860 [Siccirubricoccus deserti]